VRIPAVFDPFGNLVAPEQIIPGSDFNAAIEALIEDSSTRTLSRPHIMVIDGQLARFEVSTMEPYANTHYNEHGSATSLDIQFMEIGIILETVPRISDDGFVTMEVRPEVSTLVREEFFETTVIPDEGGAIINSIRVPVKSQNRASTVIKVRDRQTIAIGGLRTREEIEVIRKVPILGDIPILGLPFRNLHKGREKRELIIFITPHIVSGEDSSIEAAKLSRADFAEDKEEGSDVSTR
jgi:type II secretory pathway component GspD/PulD (secretin)